MVFDLERYFFFSRKGKRDYQSSLSLSRKRGKKKRERERKRE